MSKKIKVLGAEITLSSQKKEDYISLTDIARYKNPEHPADVIKNWTRSKDTIEFLGLWERINNPDFKVVEFDQFRNQAGNNSFVLSPKKWIESTNAEGIVSKSGKYGSTFAHNDIAFEFASWVSAEFGATEGGYWEVGGKMKAQTKHFAECVLKCGMKGLGYEC